MKRESEKINEQTSQAPQGAGNYAAFACLGASGGPAAEATAALMNANEGANDISRDESRQEKGSALQNNCPTSNFSTL